MTTLMVNEEVGASMLTPLLIFINPGSGGGLAPDLIARVEGDPSVRIVRLPDEASSWADTHAEILEDNTLRCVACGGDGTVNWVVSLLNHRFGMEASGFRPPMAVIPFGTGNDMSRSLGWGRGMTNNKIVRIRERLDRIRRSTDIEESDVWQIEVKRSDTDETVTHRMLNYFSVGVDARCAYDFEKCRTDCRECFCCRCMSLFWYVPVAMSNLCCRRPLRDYMHIDLDMFEGIDGKCCERHRLETVRRDKSLSFITIPSMYAGLDPWICDIPRAMNDHKLEVVAQGGAWSLGFFQIGCPTSRPRGQVSSARLEATEPVYYQIDGEGRMANGPCVITVSLAGSYPLIFRSDRRR